MAGVTSSILLGLAAANTAQSFFGRGTPTPTLPDTSAQDAAARTAAALASVNQTRRAKGGRSSTLLTGPMGVTTPPPVQRKTLLGI